jgi:transposase InsO family protein
MTRRNWIGVHAQVTQKRQCVLAGVARASVYAQRQPKVLDVSDELLKRLIDEEYTKRPFYGSRKMVVYLARCGHQVNRKRAQRLMRSLGLAGMAPGPNTSRVHPRHKVYPYLLRGVPVVRINQVWSTDITYIRLGAGFAYLVAIIDWYSKRVLSWRISNTMEAVFCVDCLEPVQSLLSNRVKKAKCTNCKLVLSLRSQFFQSLRFFSNHAKLRSTTQRWGMTSNVCSSLRLASCTVTSWPSVSRTPCANGSPE